MRQRDKVLAEPDEVFVETPTYRGTGRRERQQTFEGDDQRGLERVGPSGLLKWVCGSIIAAAATMTAINTLGEYAPEMKAHAEEAHAAINKRVDGVINDISDIKGDVSSLKKDVGGILTTGKKTQLLAVRSRLAEIQDRMAKLSPESPIWKDYQKERIELDEDLRALRTELGK